MADHSDSLIVGWSDCSIVRWSDCRIAMRKDWLMKSVCREFLDKGLSYNATRMDKNILEVA